MEQNLVENPVKDFDLNNWQNSKMTVLTSWLFLSLSVRYLFTLHSSVEMRHLAWLMLVILWMVQAVDGCPDVCKCSRKYRSEKTEVNCHKRGLRAFPSKLPPDAWILKLGKHVVNQMIIMPMSHVTLLSTELF